MSWVVKIFRAAHACWMCFVLFGRINGTRSSIQRSQRRETRSGGFSDGLVCSGLGSSSCDVHNWTRYEELMQRGHT